MSSRWTAAGVRVTRLNGLQVRQLVISEDAAYIEGSAAGVNGEGRIPYCVAYDIVGDRVGGMRAYGDITEFMPPSGLNPALAGASGPRRRGGRTLTTRDDERLDDGLLDATRVSSVRPHFGARSRVWGCGRQIHGQPCGRLEARWAAKEFEDVHSVAAAGSSARHPLRQWASMNFSSSWFHSTRSSMKATWPLFSKWCSSAPGIDLAATSDHCGSQIRS
jgi:hypothetical protein